MNLIICTTPFQVLLAEKIMEKNPNEEYVVKYISFVRNKKHTYYFDKLKSKAINSQFVYLGYDNKLEFIYSLLKIKLLSYGLNRFPFKKIFLSNIDNIFIHVYLSAIMNNVQRRLQVYTFDDGTANLIKNSFLYQENISYKKRILYFFLCRNINLTILKNKSEKHYSIYEGKENIIKNIEYLRLYPCKDDNIRFVDKNNLSLPNLHLKEFVKEEKILLGQPIYELDGSKKYDKYYHYNLIHGIIKDFEIDYYFPHPRDDTNVAKILGHKIIDTPKIFEDYFFENFEPKVKYIIYTFFSSSIFAIIHLPNVEIVFIRNQVFSIDFSYIFPLLDGFNFSIIDY